MIQDDQDEEPEVYRYEAQENFNEYKDEPKQAIRRIDFSNKKG